MTTPVEETQPAAQKPPPPSPQLADTEETLAQAEESLVPIIVGAVLSASLLLGENEEPNYGPMWGVLAKGVLVPAQSVVRATVQGFQEIVRGAILNALIPLLLANLFRFDSRARYRGALRAVAEESTEFAVDQAAKALEQIARQVGSPDAQAFYNAVSTTNSQQQLEVFARRTARWMVREALFRAQEMTAGNLGYTHKRWVTERDERVRTSHRELDGRTVRLSGSFRTQDGSIRYPGDVTAPVHLWINCRCSLEWITR